MKKYLGILLLYNLGKWCHQPLITVVAVAWLGYALYQFVRTHKGQDETEDAEELTPPQTLIEDVQVAYHYIPTTHFEQTMNQLDKPGQSGDVLVAEMAQERPVGAIALLTTGILKARQSAIQSGLITRSDEKRKQANTPGYDLVSHQYAEVAGKKVNLYHRTHLLPFRFTLSEGDDIDGLLFTGTAHLNHGDRPSINYLMPNNQARVNQLYAAYQNNHYRLTLRDTHVPGEVAGTNYSLDDFEQLATRIILSKKQSETEFKYEVSCHYDEQEVVPQSITVNLWDLTHQALAFSATLPNTL
ncbi:hypothetical protein ACPBEH_10435 [Latilactobacillus sp. 5-91]|uniref:hypothetical protein n=1 Tax=Latilactobacillus sp. 5-91 TaxID=3410924 RepID=UPI003C74853A